MSTQRSRGAMPAHIVIGLLISWGVFTFGAVYAWSYWPLAAGSLLVAILAFSLTRGHGLEDLSALSAAFLVFAAAALLQVLPLKPTWLAAVSSETPKLLQQWDLSDPVGAGSLHGISIVPKATLTGVVLFAAHALLLLGSARLFSKYGARRVSISITAIAATVAAAAVVQQRLWNGKIYGFWVPYQEGAPFGPFVNRNHFAGWMLMAIPVAIGSLCGSLVRGTRHTGPGWRNRLVWLTSWQCHRSMLIGAAAFLMMWSLLRTMSRSGVSALAIALALTAAAVVYGRRSNGKTLAAAYITVVLAVVVGWSSTDALAARFARRDEIELNDRRGAWQDAVGVASRFRAAGTGLNTYGVAMLFYQQHDPSKHYSAAHNDYLQLAAEGGVLLTVPALCCLVFFVRTVRRRFIEETSTSTYWLRVGAVTGIVAIALQETVDFSLQIPGNTTLFAVLCGIALHRRPTTRTLPPATGRV